MKGTATLPMPGSCHRTFLWLPHLNLLFLAKATQSPGPLSCVVVTDTVQGFLTSAYLICHMYSTPLNQKGHPSFFYCNWDDKYTGYLLKKNSYFNHYSLVSDKVRGKDIVERNICKIFTKVLTWNRN